MPQRLNIVLLLHPEITHDRELLLRLREDGFEKLHRIVESTAAHGAQLMARRRTRCALHELELRGHRANLNNNHEVLVLN